MTDVVKITYYSVYSYKKIVIESFNNAIALAIIRPAIDIAIY